MDQMCFLIGVCSSMYAYVLYVFVCMYTHSMYTRVCIHVKCTVVLRRNTYV